MFKKGYTPWNKGKALGEETKKKISDRTKGEKNPNFGRKFSLESRKKMSESHMGQSRPCSEETKKKISEALKHNIFLTCLFCSQSFRIPRCRSKTKYCSMECRNESYKGRKQSLETIKKRFKNAFKGGRKASKKRWKEKNKDLVNHHMRTRRFRLRGSTGTHTLQEWEDLKKFYNYMCLCCKQQEPFIKLTADHVIPVTSGGSSHIGNIQPLCQKCNSMKYTSVIDYRVSLVT